MWKNRVPSCDLLQFKQVKATLLISLCNFAEYNLSWMTETQFIVCYLIYTKPLVVLNCLNNRNVGG